MTNGTAASSGLGCRGAEGPATGSTWSSTSLIGVSLSDRTCLSNCPRTDLFQRLVRSNMFLVRFRDTMNRLSVIPIFLKSGTGIVEPRPFPSAKRVGSTDVLRSSSKNPSGRGKGVGRFIAVYSPRSARMSHRGRKILGN